MQARSSSRVTCLATVDAAVDAGISIRLLRQRDRSVAAGMITKVDLVPRCRHPEAPRRGIVNLVVAVRLLILVEYEIRHLLPPKWGEVLLLSNVDRLYKATSISIFVTSSPECSVSPIGVSTSSHPGRAGNRCPYRDRS